MTDKEAVKWFKIRIDKLTGYTMEDMNTAFKLAIDALESRQAMKEILKRPSDRRISYE